MKILLFIALFLTVLPARLPAADLLVAMSGGGTVERYNSGRHVGTLISKIDRPNALAYGPDGALYVATGAVGGPGSVKKFHGVTGRFLGDFISVPAGQPGYLARASDIVWYDGDCFVVSCDDSKVHRYDGKTGAFKATVATGNPKGWITRIAVRDGAVFTTEFNEGRIRRFPLAGGEPEVFVEQAGFTPWGIAFDQGGRCWWSGSGGIARYDGKTNVVVVTASEVTTPVALAVSPDGQLVCSSNGLQSVTVWDISEDAPKLLQTITGPEVRDPAGVAFTTQTFEAPAQFGNFVPQPSNTGRNWTPTEATIYNLRADAAFPVIAEFGLDTEGGDRAKTQLLREPMRLVFTLADGRLVDAWDVPAKRQLSPGKVEYQFSPTEGIDARWSVWTDNELLRMSLALDGANAGQVTKSELLIPFDPRAMGTTILAEEWGAEGEVKAPLIISALDMGQLRLSGAGSDEALACRFTGSRHHKRIDLRVGFPAGVKSEIVFAPARLEKPKASISDAAWAKVRRGLISLIQITPFMPVNEDGSGWLGSPGGIIGNNVISDPVSCNMDRNLQWLAGMGDKAVITGIDLNKIARKTIEFWLNQHMNDDGSIDYVLQKGNISADSDTGIKRGPRDVMQALWDAFEATEYRDSAMGKTVDYIDSRTANFTGFYWGIPCNLEDVPDDYNFQHYGTYEFPYYCNGGIFPQDAVAAVMAFSSVGMDDKADIIRRELFRRQHEGILPNGSGFYMGVVNVPGQCYSILKWDGTPTDYEGIISRDCSFLQSAILSKDPAHALFDEVVKTNKSHQ